MLCYAHYVAENDRWLLTFLLPPPQCWEYRLIPPCSFIFCWNSIEPKTLGMLGKDSTTELCPYSQIPGQYGLQSETLSDNK